MTQVHRSPARLSPALTASSRFLSLVLRHNPEAIDVAMDANGWVKVEELLQQAAAHGRSISHAQLQQIVAHNNKRRFSFSDDGQRIRANQGHTVDIDLNLPLAEPPAKLYYSTAPQRLERILKSGIRGGQRGYVQLRPRHDDALAIGAARPGALLIGVDAAAMHTAGVPFRQTDNRIWLVPRVEPEHISGWEILPR